MRCGERRSIRNYTTMGMDDVILSIYVTTYNHGKYIAQALDSILMQKTGYSYEVLIGEDVSSDNTREILRQYEEKYPGKFTIFYRDHNMNKETPSNGDDLRSRCRGKYVVALEGDDFWTDEYKLEKQINFLEAHPEYIAVSHRCVVVGGDSRPNGEVYPECRDERYTLNHYVSEIMPGQLATVMYRNYLYDHTVDTSILVPNLGPKDRRLYFMLASHGQIYCMQEKMSAYRHITREGDSFSATNRYDFEKEERWYRILLEYAYGLENKQAQMCAEVLYLSRIMHAYALKKCSFRAMMRYIRETIRRPFRTFGFYVIYKIRKNILKKELYLKLDKVAAGK